MTASQPSNHEPSAGLSCGWHVSFFFLRILGRLWWGRSSQTRFFPFGLCFFACVMFDEKGTADFSHPSNSTHQPRREAERKSSWRRSMSFGSLLWSRSRSSNLSADSAAKARSELKMVVCRPLILDQNASEGTASYWLDRTNLSVVVETGSQRPSPAAAKHTHTKKHFEVGQFWNP